MFSGPQANQTDPLQDDDFPLSDARGNHSGCLESCFMVQNSGTDMSEES